MSGILVDYACRACGAVTEHRVATPAPDSLACPGCAAPARRKFGFRLGARSAGASGGQHAPDGGPGGGHGHDHPDGLGTCGLLPTAARALTARLRGDERALEREFRHQERAIADGSLDPRAGVHGLAHPQAPAPVPAPASSPAAG